jgi:uncharacterized membrane protein
MADLYVLGRDVGGNQYGFKIDLDIANAIINGNAEITFKIYDGTTLVATNTNPIIISGGGSEDLHEIPFVQSGKEDHIFKKNSEIRVNINASITSGSLPITITYDNGFNEGYLELECNPISSKSVSARHSDGTLGEFYPNLPNDEQRLIQFKGSVTDKFGAYDIQDVELTLQQGSQNIFTSQQANYTFTKGSATGTFAMDYTYPAGLSPGEYTITADIQDNSNNHHLTSSTFSMARYGVYLEIEDPNGKGIPNEIVPFNIDVYNVGGESDIIDLGATPDLAGWVASFQGGSKTGSLAPSESQTKVLEVTVSKTAAKNEECIVTVTGEASNNKKETLLISVVASSLADFEFNPPAQLEKTLPEDGGSVEYAFRLINIGQDEDSYTVTGAQPSGSGWSARLSTSHPDAVKISDFEYTIDLDSSREAGFSFTVTAQSKPSVVKMELDVEATAENASSSIKHKTITIVTTEPGTITLTAVNNMDSKEANPGESIGENDTMNVGFSIEVENKDQLETFSVILDVSNLRSDWEHSFSATSFDLDAGRSRRITLALTLPETTLANPDSGYQVNVKATYGTASENLGDKTLPLTITVPEVLDIQLLADENEKTVEAGKKVIYEVSVINKGNVEDVDVDITVSDLVDWDVSISQPTVTLGAYNTEIKITISITPSTSVDDEDRGILDVQAKLDGRVISNTLPLKTSVKKNVGSELADFFKEYWFIPVLVVIIFILTFIIRSRLK